MGINFFRGGCEAVKGSSLAAMACRGEAESIYGSRRCPLSLEESVKSFFACYLLDDNR